VKPENLLVNNKLQCVLSDLGSCHKFEGEDVEVGSHAKCCNQSRTT